MRTVFLLSFTILMGAMQAGAAQPVRIDGSSTVHPIMVEAARRHNAQNFEVQYSGTTGGFRKFCAGETEISNASRPINTDEMAFCAAAGVEYIELPIAVDALTFVIHPENSWVNHLTLEELRRIWEPAAAGKVMRWSDVRQGWPDEPLVLFGRGQNSGTYDYFTGAVVGEIGASRRDYTASEDVDYLARRVAADKNALGFFGIGGYVKHWESLRDVAVDAGRGPVHPGIRSVQAGEYTPLTRPLFIYVNAEAAGRPQLGGFIEETYNTIERWVVFTGYMPFSSAEYRVVLDHFRNGRKGTAFDGVINYDMPLPSVVQAMLRQ